MDGECLKFDFLGSVVALVDQGPRAVQVQTSVRHLSPWLPTSLAGGGFHAPYQAQVTRKLLGLSRSSVISTRLDCCSWNT